MIQFSIMLLNDLSFPSPTDVIRPCPLRPSSLWHHSMPWCRVRRKKLLGQISGAECTGQGNNFELVLRVKIKTRHPVEGAFGNEFPLIYNHRGVMVATPESQDAEKNWSFAFFKTTLMGKFSKFCSKIFIATPIDVLCTNFVKFGRQEIGKVVRNLPNKKLLPGSPDLPTARIASKICQGECSKFHPNRFVIFEHHHSVLQSESNIR